MSDTYTNLDDLKKDFAEKKGRFAALKQVVATLEPKVDDADIGAVIARREHCKRGKVTILPFLPQSFDQGPFRWSGDRNVPATRDHGRQDAFGAGRSQDEYRCRWWLLKRLQQNILGFTRHVGHTSQNHDAPPSDQRPLGEQGKFSLDFGKFQPRSPHAKVRKHARSDLTA